MRKTRKEKGITLVALIITIIVMMILVGVSVSMLINSDLLGTAKNAGKNYREQMDAEQNMGTGDIQIGDKTWDEFMQSICNHEFGEWVVESEPESIYEDGERYRDCEKCGIRQTETIKMNACEEDAHTWSEYIIDKNPTCREVGKQHKTCSTCGSEIEEGIPVDNVNGHNYTEATCTAKATCTLCGGETGELADHQYENGECKVCGAEEPVPVTAADVATMSRAVKRDEYYGKTVDYGVKYGDYTSDGYGTSKNAWEIFYIGPNPADSSESHIYLITRGYFLGGLSITGYNGTTDFVNAEGDVVLDATKFPAVAAGWLNKVYDPTAETKLKYSSSYNNMKATEYLLDSTVTKWSGLKSEKADWVIGGPTYEMLIASYNDYYDKSLELSVPRAGSGGYVYSAPTPFPTGTYLCHNHDYCLASPSIVNGGVSMNVNPTRSGGKDFAEYNTANLKIRPVVCLSSTVQITWNEAEGQFNLD